MENPFDDDISRFSVIFTRAVVAWNGVEHSARQILTALSRGGVGAHAAILHLGNVALKDALMTVADAMKRGDREEDPLAHHVEHFVDGMDLLRAYRNFYVHSLRILGKIPVTTPGQSHIFMGLLLASEAKGRLAWTEQQLSIDELSTFLRHTQELADYGHHLTLVVSPGNALRPPAPKPQISSLEKPIWPERLKKHRRYL